VYMRASVPSSLLIFPQIMDPCHLSMQLFIGVVLAAANTIDGQTDLDNTHHGKFFPYPATCVCRTS